jgi:hypothetical protein
LQTFGRWCKDTPGWWVPLSFRRSSPCHLGEAIEAAGLLAARFRLHLTVEKYEQNMKKKYEVKKVRY